MLIVAWKEVHAREDVVFVHSEGGMFLNESMPVLSRPFSVLILLFQSHSIVPTRDT